MAYITAVKWTNGLSFHRCPQCRWGYGTRQWEIGTVTCPHCRTLHEIGKDGIARLKLINAYPGDTRTYGVTCG